MTSVIAVAPKSWVKLAAPTVTVVTSFTPALVVKVKVASALTAELVPTWATDPVAVRSPVVAVSSVRVIVPAALLAV
ncbi:MAG: Uncharacterised protein [Porticoccaceae bacterium UBA1117]|nr:MAG: Uncharacterised protein [Porticoccaceae bacterium UBA1117]